MSNVDKNELVLKVLRESEEPLKAGEIAEKAGLDKKDVDKAIKDLKKEDKIESPKRCFYTAK
ncbi:MAG TPA: HTH domain-containing protein [Acholeplasmataceae bacterium]|jgi:DNA-binding MarR family transcriptional regulator|nr:HTH domain-containing protein [Acholeplasmataceae bacterium]